MKEQLLFSVLDQLPGFFYLQAKDYTIPYANRIFRERFGNPEGRTCYRVYHGISTPCRECRTFKVFKTKKPQKWEWTALDDRTYQIYDHPFAGPDGSMHVLKLGIDITDRKKMEDELVRARKLESVALLAGGIAHDFNNLLTSIMGNISLARMFLPRDEKVAGRLMDAERSCLRAKDLTWQLVAFAKGEAPAGKIISVARLLQETAGFALGHSNCKCEFSLLAGLWPVEADDIQIGQVVHNLLMNAQDAMPEGGVIKIGAENTIIGPEDFIPLPAGNYVKIFVRDHGAGIRAEHLPRVFDPYFTTQQMDSRKGLGLGLALCYSVVKNHGGHITAESSPGNGTVFYVYLPASQVEGNA